jgi:hypothetical protein
LRPRASRAVTAKLIDVYSPSAWHPQGYALNLTDSIARLRYRNGRERGKLVKAAARHNKVSVGVYRTVERGGMIRRWDAMNVW